LSRICYAHGTDVPAGNATVSDWNLKIGRNAPNLTNNERRLTQHAPWVVNLQLGVTVLEQSIGVVHKFDVSYKF